MKNQMKWRISACAAALAMVTGSVNAAELNIVSASDWGSAHGSYPASNAIDGSTSWASRWAAYNDSSSEAVNLIAQLDSVQRVTEVGVAWGQGASRAHTFEIWARAATSGSWTKIYDDVSSGSTSNIEVYDVTDIDAQQVRIKTFFNSTGTNWTNITEMEVYGSGSSSSTHSVPGVIEAEDFNDYYDTTSGNTGGAYRTDEDVDIQVCTDGNNCGYNVGWTKSGEWLEYDINVSSAGNYEADLSLATPKSNKSLSVSIDGSNVTGSVAIDNTSDWQLYYLENVDLGYLSAGNHTLRINAETGDFNLNWIDVKEEGSTGTLDPNQPPSGNFDLSQWKITLPTSKDAYFGDGGTAAAEIQPDDCSNSLYTGDGLDEGFEDSDYFYTGSDGAMVFVTPLTGGASTITSSYVRSELRELYNWSPCDDDGAANWSPSGKHTLSGTLSVTDYYSSDPQTVVGQIHAKDSSYALVKLQWDGPTKDIRAIMNSSASSSSSFSLDFGLIPGTDEWSYVIELEDDTVTISVTYDGDTVTKSVTFGEGVMDDNWLDHVYYFKAGNYAQADKDSGGNFEVRFTALDVNHN